MSSESDSFQRWQRIAMDQLGYVLNLFLGFTVAALGYWFVLVKDPAFVPGSTAKRFMIASVISLAVATSLGAVCIVNRLLDFRGTAQRARRNANAPSKTELHVRGRVTWWLFYAQLISFGAGISAIAIAQMLTYGSKLT